MLLKQHKYTVKRGESCMVQWSIVGIESVERCRNREWM